jgi:hypothetical protein
MSEYFELAKALVQHQKALLELESALNDVRKMLTNVADDEPEPIPSDEELERRSENRRAWRQPYDWMTELED